MSASGSQGSLQRIGQAVANWSERWVPSPFLFAIILTLIAYVTAIVLTPDGPFQNILNWYEGFWVLLEFAMQMVLILVTGYAVADSRQVSGLLNRIASIPNNGSQAAALVAAVAMGAGYFHWGVGLIVGAIFAVFVARAGLERGMKFHYPLLCACGYTSQVIWHVGPSTSAGLLSATEGHPFEDIIGVVPLSESVFTVYAFGLALLVFLTVVPLMYLLAPEEGQAIGIDEYAPELLDEGADGRTTADERAATDGGTEAGRMPADRLDDSRLVAYLVGTGMLVYVVQHFATAGIGEALDLNVFNFTFIALGLFLYGTPMAYMGAIRGATESAAGIILQFPFYAGILGIIENSGLSELMAGFLLDIATPTTFPVLAWILGGIMNFFVPSGGGEWGIIGGIVGETAVELGVAPGKAIIAYGTGDMWTNMFQPFWAIPLLGITKVRARDILGYTLIVMIVLTPVFAVGLYFLPY
ncbi:short-chain fatty acid transporter [Halalkalicoccus sp. GCM10025322]|uniref:short-chain fatty acid transporter n=1 Tax=Halalkalicoccus TaxID=332246 RepID=UPI002F9644C2